MSSIRSPARGRAANSEIDAFYQDFSAVAVRMVDLEARVERWKTEGYLCERYADCAEKYDLIYASYAQSMAEIQQAFERHQDGILAALSQFNRVVYQGKDKLSDLRSDDLAALPGGDRPAARGPGAAQDPQRGAPAGVPRTHGPRMHPQVARVRSRPPAQPARDQARGPTPASSRGCAARCSNALTACSTDTATSRRTPSPPSPHYAFIFEQYGGLSGSEGIGGLLAGVKGLAQLNTRLRQMQDFGKGLQVHLLDMGNLLNDRLGLLEGEDLEVGSRREVLTDSGNLLEANDRLLRELEQELEG